MGCGVTVALPGLFSRLLLFNSVHSASETKEIPYPLSIIGLLLVSLFLSLMCLAYVSTRFKLQEKKNN